MKREYTKPEVEITRFTTEDIITTSSNPTTKLPIDDDNTTVIDGSIFN